MEEIKRYYIVLVCYAIFYLFGGWQLGEYAWIFLIPLAVTYIQAVRILVRLMWRKRVVAPKERNKDRIMREEIKAAALTLGLVFLHLYFGVLCVRTWIPGAYAFSYEGGGYVTDWDLLYYTLLHFTEIGCGDIIPQHTVSRVMAMVIAVTSVLCLILFLGSFLEEEEELEENEN